MSGQSEPTLFIYDGDGNLVKQIRPDGNKTLYVGGIYEVNKNAGGAVTGTKTYYPAAGAMRDGSTLYYVLKDHLGSASVLTDASGTIVAGAETRYYPFGEARLDTGPMVTDKLFTGQRQIAELGIYHYGARFYSPKLGRFLSADTIVPGYANPQSLNRFSYVLNNPLRYIDPTGHRPEEGQEGKRGCSNSLYCTNGHMKPKQELARMLRASIEARRKQNDGSGGGSTTALLTATGSAGTTSASLSSPLGNYNYAVGMPQIPLHESHTITHDLAVTGQTTGTYSNGSNTTLSLYPPSIRRTFSHENGLSSNFTMNPDLEFSDGYGQSLAGEALTSLTGINLNPINGAITSRIAISSGPVTIQGQLSVQGTSARRDRPWSRRILTAAGLAVLPQAAPAAAGGYKLCQAAGVCS